MHPCLVRCHDRIQKKSPSCSYRDNNDCATCSLVLLCLSVKKRGIHRAHTFEYWRCCLIIVFTLPSLMFSIPDNSRTVIRLFSRMSASTRSLFKHGYLWEKSVEQRFSFDLFGNNTLTKTK